MRAIQARARPRVWALVVLSALLQGFSFPVAGPLPYWRAFAAWFALTPLLVALIADGRLLRVRGATLAGYVCGVLFYLGNCYWIFETMHLYGGLPRPVALLILLLFALYLGLYHALFALLLSWLRCGLGGAWALAFSPFVWVAVELARGRVTGFPWDLLGYAQVDNSVLTRLAPVTGVMGISLVLSATAALLAAGTVLRGRLRIVWPAVGLLAAACLQLAGLPAGTADAAPATYAVLLQENLAVGAEGRAEQPLSLTDELRQFTALSARASAQGIDQTGRPPALVLWPEAPSHLQTNDPTVTAALGNLAQSVHAPVIAGSLGVDPDSASARGYRLYDSAALFAADGSARGRYDKIHLVPWGEYVPFKRLFAFAQKLTEGVGDMDRGSQRTVFATGGHTYGVFICYESIFGDEVRHFVANGAEVLVNLSDDGWYGDSGAPWQHLNMARMRAIENHRWLLRATNTGVTTSIAPNGRLWAQAPRHVRAAFALPFGYRQGTTFYTRHGDWLAWLCVAVTLAALAAAAWYGLG